MVLGAALAAGAPAPEATSLLGEPLYAPALAAEQRAEYESKLAAARARYGQAPDQLESIVWLGRRTAYLGRFREAIAIYSRGLELHPESAELLRHRGHRAITVRELELALADLKQAARLIEGRPDVVEPDGLPNRLNIPTSTLHGNIWYHLGLAQFLKRDFAAAAAAYRKGLATARSEDMRIAFTIWLVWSLKRLGRDQEVETLLAGIDPELKLIENGDYLELLLLCKSLRTADELLEAGSSDPVSNATLGFGVGQWHLTEGRAEQAEAIFRRVVAAGHWPAFGHLAAEAELACLGK